MYRPNANLCPILFTSIIKYKKAPQRNIFPRALNFQRKNKGVLRQRNVAPQYQSNDLMMISNRITDKILYIQVVPVYYPDKC